MTRHVAGAIGSKWANPFTPRQQAEKSARLAAYEQHVRDSPDLMASLGELDNKVLGCWCHPEGCHGDVLVKLVNERKQPSQKSIQSQK
jgi:hypothetical protein